MSVTEEFLALVDAIFAAPLGEPPERQLGIIDDYVITQGEPERRAVAYWLGVVARRLYG